MTHSTSTGEGHIEHGDLVRFIDREMTVSERASAAAHLLRCAECSRSLDVIRSERQLLADVLGQLSVPEVNARRREQSWSAIEKAAARPAAQQKPGRRTVGLAAAAVAATVLVTTFTVSPVRAFVADLWSDIASRTGLVRTTVLEPTPIRVAGATIGFVPSVDSFLLEVRTTQREGSLILGANEGASVNARAEGGDEVVDIVILPDSGMRIENTMDETGAYAVNLPATLREVRVRIGDAPEIVYGMDTLRESWITVIDLTPDGVSSAVQPVP